MDLFNGAFVFFLHYGDLLHLLHFYTYGNLLGGHLLHFLPHGD